MSDAATTDYSLTTATVTFVDRGEDQDITVTYSDKRESNRGIAYHGDREGATSPDAWLGGDLSTAPEGVIEAIATRGNEDGSPMTVEVPSVYVAEELSDGWSVHDTQTGARWWPGAEAKAGISAADDEEAETLRLCHEQPTAGEWHQ